MTPDILIQAYQTAATRILLFDYDGTLAELQPTPPEAAPTAELLTLLAALCHDPRNTVVIVSGRDRDTLDAWLGDLPLQFAAEHGFWRKDVSHVWQETIAIDTAWQAAVKGIMQAYIQQLAGTLIEEKAAGIAWHYRTAADPTAAERAASELAGKIEVLRLPIRVIAGNKVIEVQPAGINKGAAASFWLQQQSYDFMLAAGDDMTDEDLLGAMPTGSYTIKIGGGDTVAALRLPDPAALRQLIAAVTA